MPPPKKNSIKFQLMLACGLHEWLKSQVPERGANAQQVAIDFLEEAQMYGGTQERFDRLEANEADVDRKNATIANLETEMERYRARVDAQDALILRLTEMLDRAMRGDKTEG